MWLSSLSGSETNQFSTSEGKGRSDKDRAEAFEAVLERAGVGPVSESDVATVVAGDSTTVGDDTEDDETAAGYDLDDGENELDLAVAANTENVDGNQEDQEDCDPYCH